MFASKVISLFYTAIFLFSTPSICYFCGVDNLPEFRKTGHLQRDGLPSGIAALIPSYNFSCAGHVKQWRAHVERRRNRYDRYDLNFSIWRRTESHGEDCTYKKVGENSYRGLAPEIGENSTILGTVTLNVIEEQRVLVQPGDFVGFQVQHYEVDWLNGQRVKLGVASIMVDLNRTDVLVWNRPLPFEQTRIHAGMFQPHPLPAAPYIHRGNA